MNKRSACRRSLAVFAIAAVVTTLTCRAGILPSQANPRGTSLDEITFALAKFQDTFDPSFLPDTRFQLLVVQDFDPDTGNGIGNYAVRPGTFFFVPVFSFNDSPPVIGDFPANSSQVFNYIFGAQENGLQAARITVDGQVFDLGPSYLSSLVSTPGLPNGGSHTILMGAFLHPLPKGTHTITISASFSGTAFVNAVGGPVSFENVYTVTVR